ncbi:putative DNA polymerase POL4 [Lasiosphaeria hispida]|uniref:DNA polymerase n=1 Tax=Lasiosphaeria hispida TaxID=260671 RepID=A0AAJ0HWS9_9PEZI|nr:putative DNA polymerase POL4 [Lasiosphaeria hispida]
MVDETDLLVFFRNDDTSMVKRLRIRTVIQMGAAWVRAWGARVTHVIVDDEDLSYGDLAKYLAKQHNISQLPPGVVLTNYDYVVDCLRYRRLLNPGQYRYRVEGAPESAKPPAESSPDPGSPDCDSSRASPAPDGPGAKNKPTEATEQIKPAGQPQSDDDQPPRGDGKTQPVRGADRGNFLCMNPAGKRASQTANGRTIKVLQELATYYDRAKDAWRSAGYRKAMAILARQTTEITTEEEARGLRGVGGSIAAKIAEIAQTGRLRKLEHMRNDPRERVLDDFVGIYGVGRAQAVKWYAAGHRTRDDLRRVPLTANQAVGLDHYDDFQARVPRREVEAHGEMVRAALQRLDPACSVTIVGSYRRGAADSGDIDLLLTKAGASLDALRPLFFDRLIPDLEAASFIKATLVASGTRKGGKWQGASCLPGSTVWRRLDMLVVPDAEIGAALLYFTGSDLFNRSMRLLARNKDMRLNEYGLFGNVIRGKGGEHINDGTLIEARDERRIFAELGLEWREPEERSC